MMRALRILVPNYPAPDSFTDNVAYTLMTMGHEVRFMNVQAFRDTGRLQRIFYDAISGYSPKLLSAQERWVLEQAREWKADLVVCLTLALRDEVLHDLKRSGVGLCVAWWGDTPANMRGMGLLADGWDRIYIKDAQAVEKFRAVDLPADYLPEAANPDWHVAPIKESKFEGELVVAGNYYGYRQMLIKRLVEKEVHLALYGPRPPRWANEIVRARHKGKYIVKHEKASVFNVALACLNSTALSEGNSLNCRAFEIAASGGLQLIENKAVVSDCFEPNKEVLTYGSVEDILLHLDRARSDLKWSRTIREAGQARVLAEHTYRHRLQRILTDIGLNNQQAN